VDTPPEVAFPEPTPALSEERANLMEVTPVDIQLMEIRQHEGPEAVWRKLSQLDAAEDRRYRRSQAQLAHARHVVRAAAQNAPRNPLCGALASRPCCRRSQRARGCRV